MSKKKTVEQKAGIIVGVAVAGAFALWLGTRNKREVRAGIKKIVDTLNESVHTKGWGRVALDVLEKFIESALPTLPRMLLHAAYEVEQAYVGLSGKDKLARAVDIALKAAKSD